MKTERPNVSMPLFGLVLVLSITLLPVLINLGFALAAKVTPNVYVRSAIVFGVLYAVLKFFWPKVMAWLRGKSLRDKSLRPTIERSHYDIFFAASVATCLVSFAVFRLHANTKDAVGPALLTVVLVSMVPALMGLIWVFVRDNPRNDPNYRYRWWHYAPLVGFFGAILLIAFWRVH